MAAYGETARYISMPYSLRTVQPLDLPVIQSYRSFEIYQFQLQVELSADAVVETPAPTAEPLQETQDRARSSRVAKN